MKKISSMLLLSMFLFISCNESSDSTPPPLGRVVDPVTTVDLERAISGTQWNLMGIYTNNVRYDSGACNQDEIYSFNSDYEFDLEEGAIPCDGDTEVFSFSPGSTWAVVSVGNTSIIKVSGEGVGVYVTLSQFELAPGKVRLLMKVEGIDEALDVEFQAY